jgi:tellurite resistance protein
MSPVFEERRRALEEQFFKQHDEKLIQQMKDASLHEATQEELKALTGITNPQILSALADLKVGGGAAVLVMSLYPLVEVAWADGTIDQAERTVLLELSASIGLKPGSPAYDYLTKWLAKRPETLWHPLWADYTRALSAMMKPDDRTLLKATILGRARVVAEASGGFLGVAWRVSEAEHDVLAQLEKAFD